MYTHTKGLVWKRQHLQTNLTEGQVWWPVIFSILCLCVTNTRSIYQGETFWKEGMLITISHNPILSNTALKQQKQQLQCNSVCKCPWCVNKTTLYIHIFSGCCLYMWTNFTFSVNMARYAKHKQKKHTSPLHPKHMLKSNHISLSSFMFVYLTQSNVLSTFCLEMWQQIPIQFTQHTNTNTDASTRWINRLNKRLWSNQNHIYPHARLVMTQLANLSSPRHHTQTIRKTRQLINCTLAQWIKMTRCWKRWKQQQPFGFLKDLSHYVKQLNVTRF